jgi:hypothetical protein
VVHRAGWPILNLTVVGVRRVLALLVQRIGTDLRLVHERPREISPVIVVRAASLLCDADVVAQR